MVDQLITRSCKGWFVDDEDRSNDRPGSVPLRLDHCWTTSVCFHTRLVFLFSGQPNLFFFVNNKFQSWNWQPPKAALTTAASVCFNILLLLLLLLTLSFYFENIKSQARSIKDWLECKASELELFLMWMIQQSWVGQMESFQLVSNIIMTTLNLVVKLLSSSMYSN